MIYRAYFDRAGRGSWRGSYGKSFYAYAKTQQGAWDLDNLPRNRIWWIDDSMRALSASDVTGL